MSLQLERFGQTVATSTGEPRQAPKVPTDAGVAFGRYTPLDQARPERLPLARVLANAPDAKSGVSTRPAATIPAVTRIASLWGRARPDGVGGSGGMPWAGVVSLGFFLNIITLPLSNTLLLLDHHSP